MWKYIGNGFLPPLPARDLTDQEAKGYGLEKVKKSNLYKHVNPATKGRGKDKVIKAPVTKQRGKENKL
jgi:hypothetical protein